MDDLDTIFLDKINKEVDLEKLYKEDSIFSTVVDTCYSLLGYKYMPLEIFIEENKAKLLYIAYSTRLDIEKDIEKKLVNRLEQFIPEDYKNDKYDSFIV